MSTKSCQGALPISTKLSLPKPKWHVIWPTLLILKTCDKHSMKWRMSVRFLSNLASDAILPYRAKNTCRDCKTKTKMLSVRICFLNLFVFISRLKNLVLLPVIYFLRSF